MGKVIAEADAGSGVIKADFLAALETREEHLDLVGRGEVAKGKNFASDKDVRIGGGGGMGQRKNGGTGDALEDP